MYTMIGPVALYAGFILILHHISIYTYIIVHGFHFGQWHGCPAGVLSLFYCKVRPRYFTSTLLYILEIMLQRALALFAVRCFVLYHFQCVSFVFCFSHSPYPNQCDCWCARLSVGPHQQHHQHDQRSSCRTNTCGRERRARTI